MIFLGGRPHKGVGMERGDAGAQGSPALEQPQGER
jgi:hypothetical protein